MWSPMLSPHVIDTGWAADSDTATNIMDSTPEAYLQPARIGITVLLTGAAPDIKSGAVAACKVISQRRLEDFNPNSDATVRANRQCIVRQP